MKKYLILFLLFFILKKVVAQPTNPLLLDSLKKELKNANNDTTRVLILQKLTEYYKFTNPTLAVRFGRDAWSLADSLRFDKGKVPIAILMGRIMALTSDYPEAISKLLTAVFVCQKLNLPRELVNVYSSLSYLYTTRKQFSNALDYLSKAKEIQNKNHFVDVDIFLNLISGNLYSDLGKTDSSLIFFQNAYKIAQKSNFQQQLPEISYYLGNTFRQKNQADSTLKYFRKSLSFNAPYNEGRVFLGLAQFFMSKNKMDSTIYYAKKALKHSGKYKFTATAIASAQLLSQIYEKQNNLKQALFYNKVAMTEKDSLFIQEGIREIEKISYDEKEREKTIQRKISAHQSELGNTIKIYGLSAFLLFLMILSFVLYRSNKTKHKANEILYEQKEEIHIQRNKAEKALHELKAMQAQLIQSEKLASLGELTAGIAHEIQNPLNFVNNFSELSIDLAKELKEEIEKPSVDKEFINDLVGDLVQNQEKINIHGKRASSIVKGMLEHSRSSTGQKELTDINALADEFLRLSFHGLKAKNKNFNADFKTDFDKNLPKIKVIPQEIGRVLLNLINNAFYAVSVQNVGRVKPTVELPADVKHLVEISTKKTENNIEIKIKDNGNGIPKANLEKIFQPFFTTKPTGEGTGLGLSLSYDIITKGHSGTLEVESVEGEGAEFIIKLPIS